MEGYHVTTNGHWRPIDDGLCPDWDVIPRLSFVFRGERYWLADFEVAPPPFAGTWEGYMPTSYFSGILVQMDDDQERVKVGSYYC